MKYDFTSLIDRKGKDAMAIDAVGSGIPMCPEAPKEGFDIIPMWVADMNFATCPSVSKTLIERASHPTFGYFFPKDEYYSSIIDWQEKRNGVTDLKPEYIGYENGVLAGMLTALRALCTPGDAVLLHSPTYVGFTNVIESAGYKIVLSPLVEDENGVWRMDYQDMEQKIVEHNIHTFVMCSPHNPSGRVWEKEELEKAMEICEKHRVYTVSDEIWADITLEGHRHIPTQSISEYAQNTTVALYAVSKTFNLAGIVGGYHIVYCPWLRSRVERESQVTGYNEMNVFSMHALIGAYTEEGHEWVDELRQVLAENVNFAVNYINEHFEGIKVTKPEGTYMLFADCSEWCKKHNKTIEELEKAMWDVGVMIEDGKGFHGPCHVRFNLASPLSRVQEAFERLDKYVLNAEW